MKPIIFLHGAIGAADQLQPFHSFFAQNGFTPYSFSFSGHGKTPFKNNFGIEQFSDELQEFIHDNKLAQPNIFGYSMGGYVALYFASQKPELLGTIITLGTKFNWTKEIAQKEIKMLDSNVIEEKVPKFAAALKQRHGDDWKVLLERTAKMMISLGENNLLNDILIKGIANPVMIGLADKDNMVTLEETVNVYRQLQNGLMYMLPNTKHPIETVSPIMVHALISPALT